MNSISWFLYLTDVVSNVGGVLFAIAICATIGTAVIGFGAAISEGEILTAGVKLWWPRLAFAGIAAALICAFIPSKNTMYAIAASQVGERIAKTDAAQEIASDATKALQQWIKKQIEPETKK